MNAVSRGLADSVKYGMAHNAQVAALAIAGKTGTASDPGQAWTHGWFAGFAPAKVPKVVIVIYLPRGNGADAAHLAQRFFNAYKETLLR
jgi:cell division protein FtsI/penicillin-binding protein 2